MKDAAKVFSLQKTLVQKLHRDAISQSRIPVLVIRFGDYEVTCTITKKAFGVREHSD